MGNSPATSYQQSKLVCLNADLFFTFPRAVQRFIALHEKGHIVLDTDSEIKADNYAFKRFNGSLPQSHRWSILAISRVLPFTTKEQYKRLINMYKNALIEDSYETGHSLPYEMSYLNKLDEQMDQMNDQEWKEQNAIDPVSGEIEFKRVQIEPVGEFVPIAREVWTKATLGDELTGYDLTILDKYPIPADFEAYEVDPEELFEGIEVNEPEIQKQLSEAIDTLSRPESKTKIPMWAIVSAAIIFLLLIFKK
jgi:hypothetical protein